MIHRLVRGALRLPARRCDSDVEHEAVEMHDGVRLATTHVWPIGASEPTPTLLVRTPYGVATRLPGMIWLGRILAEYGYHVVLQDVRGRYRSEGEFDPFVHEADDGADTLDWLAQRPWSEGPVGMLGASYLTHAAWAAASRRPERVGSLALAIGSSDLHPLFYPHDQVFSFANAVEWATGLGEREGVDARRVDLERAFAHEPIREADRVARTQVDFYRNWVDRPDPADAYWRGIDAGVPDPAPPTLLVAGFWDFFCEPQLDDYRALVSRAASGRGAAPRLLLGPWTHGGTAHRRFWRQGMARRALAATVDHFDETLRQGDTTASAPTRVRFFVADPGGGGEWREAADWPAPDARTHSLFLGMSSGRGALHGDPTSERVRFELAYDPLDPTPTVGGKLFGWKAGARDQTPGSLRRDVLCLETAPLARDLVVAGPVRAILFVGCDAAPADFAVQLVDATPRGAQWLVCDGLSRRFEADVDPNAARSIEISLGHAGWRFRAGHRVRLHVAPANCPRFARARPPAPNDGDGPGESRNWVVASASETSRLELVLPAGESIQLTEQPAGTDRDRAR